MDEAKRKRLEDAGWVFGSVDEFLGLSTDGGQEEGSVGRAADPTCLRVARPVEGTEPARRYFDAKIIARPV